MTLLKFRPVLTPQEVEGKLRGLRPYLKEAGWSEDVRDAGLRLDLSRVQYADFGALAQILLLVEGALRHRAPVQVALPLGRPRRGELAWIASTSGDGRHHLSAEASIRAQVRYRQGALRFMDNCGFARCLVPDHVPDARELCRVEYDYDPGQEDKAEDEDEAEHGGGEITGSEPYGRAPTNILPLEWLPELGAVEREAWEHNAIRLLTLRGVSLSPSEAEAIATVVFRELLDNVRDHAAEGKEVSCAPAALVGGVVLRNFFAGAVAVGAHRSTEAYGRWVERSGAAVLRMVVGDSGLGICNTLPFEPEFKPSQPSSGKAREWSKNESTLFYSMTPWSSRREKHETRSRYVRGLASVRRAVGEANGALLLRSGDALAGYVYPPRVREPVGEAPLAWSPGTLVDLTLAPKAVPRATEVDLAEDDSRVSAIGVTALPPPERSDELRRAFAEKVSTVEGQIALVAGDLPTDVDAHYETYLTLLQVADDLADRAGLAVIAPRQSRTELVPLLRAFDDVRAQRGDRAESPVMVIDERGQAEWMGVTSEQAAVLDTITRGPTMRARRGEILEQRHCSPAELSEILEPLRRWIGTDGDDIWVAVTPLAVAAASSAGLRESIGSAADATIETAAEGEVIVTPTLATVERWLSPEKLIEALGGPSLVGHLLGLQASSQAHREDGDAELSVVCVGSLPEALVSAFKAAVGATGREIVLAGESGMQDDPGAPFVHADTDFVCLTDVILTANHVRHAIHDLVRAGAHPRAVACVLDARDKRTELHALGHPLPVTSLLELPLVLDRPDARPRPIEPFRPPVGFQQPPAPPQPKIPTKTVLDWCAKSDDALLTGHIARLGRRHFATFLDIKRLLAGPAAGQIADAIVMEIEDWLSAEGEPMAGEEAPRQLALLHPGWPTDGGGSLAALVHSTWTANPDRLPMDLPLGFPRAVSDGRNVLLAPNTDFEAGTGAVIVDWGAVTLHTLHEMLRIAGDKGASRILAVVLTSQLDDDEEAGATTLRAIRGRSAEKSDPQPRLFRGELEATTTTTATSIRFLSSFHMGFSSVGDCAPCRLAGDYRRFADDAPTQLLRGHAGAMAKALEPRSLSSARELGAFDALGSPLPHGDAVEVLDTRQRFERARSSTAERLRLRERIESAGPKELDPIVRTLALEPRWLKLPPLRFKSVREALVGALRRRMEDEDFATLAASLRRQHFIVLRAVSKDAYLEDLPGLLHSAVRDLDDPEPANELLFGAFTLVRRPYQRSDRDRGALQDALERSQEALAPDSLEQPRLAVVGATVSALQADLEYHRGVESSRRLGPQAAWRDLRNNFAEPILAHVVELPIEVVRGAMQIEQVRSSKRWQTTMHSWQAMRSLLVRRALPVLTVVEDIVVEGLSAAAMIDQIAQARRACGPQALADLAQIDDLFTSFVGDPRLALSKREELLQRWSWWYHFFFCAKEGLMKLCEECPCEAGEVVREELNRAMGDPQATERPLGTVVVEGASSSNVFCHSDVVRRATRHLIANATQRKHAQDHDRDDPVNIRVELTEDGRRFTMRMLNDKTDADKPQAGAARGLGVNRAAVRRYGGELSGEKRDDDWTYRGTMALPLWGRDQIA